MTRIPAWAVGLVGALLLGLFLLRLLDTAVQKSLTVDEPHYIGRGLYLWKTGDYHFQRGLQLQPPLAYHLASLPLLFLGIGELPEGSHVGPKLLARDSPGPTAIRLASRLPFALVACWGGLLCFLWAREAAGPAAGLLSLFLYTFSPTLLAYGALAHSDIVVSVGFLQTLYAYWRWTRRPNAGRLLVCGVSLGLALLAKLSAVLLLPSLALLLGLAVLRPARAGPGLDERWPAAPRGRVVRAAGTYAALLAVAAVVVWVGYGGSLALADQPGGPLAQWRLPGYLRALLWDMSQNAEGRSVYFLGEIRRAAPWTYFPVAFALKLPLGTLALLGLALAWLPRRRPGLGACVGVPLALYALACLVVVAPLGIRYALPVFPLLWVFAGTQLAGFHAPWRRAAVALACVATAAASLSIHPHYLAFFNRVAGGPEGGHRFLIESNLDWGQDLGTLADWVAKAPPAPLHLAYLGPEPPRRYGIRARPLQGCRPVTGRVAISVNVLMELYHSNSAFRRPAAGCYAWLRKRTPVARPGYSIHVYEIPPPTPPPSAQ